MIQAGVTSLMELYSLWLLVLASWCSNFSRKKKKKEKIHRIRETASQFHLSLGSYVSSEAGGKGEDTGLVLDILCECRVRVRA